VDHLPFIFSIHIYVAMESEVQVEFCTDVAVLADGASENRSPMTEERTSGG